MSSPHDLPAGRVVAVNVGVPRTVAWRGQDVSTAIWKQPVAGRVRLAGVNLDGDDQADRRVHGGDEKAVYAYGADDYTWWSEALGVAVEPGAFGDNLTVSGLDVNAAVVGEVWTVGTARLQVTGPRIPCFKLGIRMGDDGFPRRFAAAARPGSYLRILAPGDVASGDTVTVVARPDHGVTVGMVERAYHADRSLTARLLEAPQLPPSWRRWAEQHLPDEVAARRAARSH